MADDTQGIPGVLVIATSPDGIVQATATDFERSPPAGFKVAEIQRHRAMARVISEIISDHCSPWLAKALDDGLSRDRIRDALRRLGWRFEDREIFAKPPQTKETHHD